MIHVWFVLMDGGPNVEGVMVGRTRLPATDQQRSALRELSRSPDRAEADRARAILWSLDRRTGEDIGQALGVRANTVRKWRRRFRAGGVDALRARPRPGKAAWKSPQALAVVEELLAPPVADRTNWTLPRLTREIAARAGVRISPSRLSVVMRQKGAFGTAGRGTASRAGRTPRPSTGPGCV